MAEIVSNNENKKRDSSIFLYLWRFVQLRSVRPSIRHFRLKKRGKMKSSSSSSFFLRRNVFKETRRISFYFRHGRESRKSLLVDRPALMFIPKRCREPNAHKRENFFHTHKVKTFLSLLTRWLLTISAANLFVLCVLPCCLPKRNHRLTTRTH